jgi:hypothetical protein
LNGTGTLVAKRRHVDPAALDEVEHAARTLDESRGLGGELLDAFEAATESICAAPDAFAPLGRTRSGVVVRSKFLRRFHYRVIFLDLPQLIWIVAFAHEKRRPFYWRARLEQKPPD